jgi:methylglyoxal synthase
VAFLYLIPFGIALVLHDRRTLMRVHSMTVSGLVALCLIMLVPIALLFAGASQVIVARFQ